MLIFFVLHILYTFPYIYSSDLLRYRWPNTYIFFRYTFSVKSVDARIVWFSLYVRWCNAVAVYGTHFVDPHTARDVFFIFLKINSTKDYHTMCINICVADDIHFIAVIWHLPMISQAILFQFKISKLIDYLEWEISIFFSFVVLLNRWKKVL